MYKPSIRITAFSTIAIVITVLFFVSGSTAQSFAGEPILEIREIQLGNLDVQLVTKNSHNEEIGIVKFSDVFIHNATLTNNYDDPIKLVYEYDMYLGIEKVYSLNKQEMKLEPQESKTLSVLNSMNYTGNISIYHKFQLYNLTDNTIIDWDYTKHETFIVFSQEVYATGFIQYLLIKHVWALAIPFVIFSVKHLVDIWKS